MNTRGFRRQSGIRQITEGLGSLDAAVFEAVANSPSELLDKTMGAGAVTVLVGSETGDLGGGELSLVVAPYTERGRVAGTVGVLGPTRMDYAKVMPLVDATAAAMSEALGKGSK